MITDILDVTNGLRVNYRARGWCSLPYPDHPKGCPNYGKKAICPPQVVQLDQWLGEYQSLWLVCVGFDLAEHVASMLVKHPNWSYRQARNLLYWQPKVNKALREAVARFTMGMTSRTTYCPEAMGLNVMTTARRAGLPIQTHPEEIVYKIALVVEGEKQGRLTL
jgi:predicted metal-binding protein